MSPRDLRALLGGARRLAGDGQAGAGHDATLLERYLSSRDERAFDELLRRHGPMVLGVCRRLLDNEHDAEDAFQATFLVLVRRAAQVRKRGSVGCWLYGVARRTALRARRDSHRRADREHRASRPEAETAAHWDDLAQILDEEVTRLPAKYRDVVVLCYLQCRTYSEAAAQLGCPEGTVAGRLSRARDLLRDQLVRRGVALTAALLAQAQAGAALAPLPDALVAASLRALDPAAPPSRASTLAEGVLRSMWLSKLRNVALLAAVVLSAVALAAHAASFPADDGPPPFVAGVGPVPKPADAPKPPEIDPGRWQAAGQMQTNLKYIKRIAQHTGGQLLAVGGMDGTVLLWDLAARKEKGRVTGTRQMGHIEALAFAPDGKEVFALALDGTLRRIRTEPFKAVATHKLIAKGSVTSSAFSPDAKLLTLTSAHYQSRMDPFGKNPFDEKPEPAAIRFVDTATGKDSFALQGGSRLGIGQLAFTADGKRLVVKGTGEHRDDRGGVIITQSQEQIRVWDLERRQVQEGYPLPLTGTVGISPDGKTLVFDAMAPHKNMGKPLPKGVIAGGPVFGTNGFQVKVCDLKTGKERLTIAGHPTMWGSVNNYTFSPDGKYLVTCSADKTAKVWDVATGRELNTLRGHGGWVQAALFLPDGRLVSADINGELRLWAAPASPGELRQ